MSYKAISTFILDIGADNVPIKVGRIEDPGKISDIGDVEDQVRIIKGGDQKSMVQMV